MLRHFKMELKRQQMELENEQRLGESHIGCQPANRPLVIVADSQAALNMKKENKPHKPQQQQQQQQLLQQPPKRVRGRRSSKPQMEKRRRARINECLDILKSYVLTDTSNLSRLGIELTGSENQDEETIARTLLKSSGLINRHRGRKNPNKLEKADILELTVDYVRRLHEQRDQLLTHTSNQIEQQQQQQQQHTQIQAHLHRLGDQQGLQVPAHLNEPLTLDLSPKSRLHDSRTTPPPTLQAYAPPPNTPLTPPSSGGAVSTEANQQKLYPNQMSQMILSRVLNSYNQCDWTTS